MRRRSFNLYIYIYIVIFPVSNTPMYKWLICLNVVMLMYVSYKKHMYVIIMLRITFLKIWVVNVIGNLVLHGRKGWVFG